MRCLRIVCYIKAPYLRNVRVFIRRPDYVYTRITTAEVAPGGRKGKTIYATLPRKREMIHARKYFNRIRSRTPVQRNVFINRDIGIMNCIQTVQTSRSSDH